MNEVPSLQVIGKESCCGCEACSNICPTSAINMSEDINGFLYPTLEEALCIKCNKCINVCPVHNSREKHDSYRKEVLIGYSKNEKVVETSSSGGFFSIIAEQALNKGNVVVGVKWDNYFKSTSHVMIDKLEDLEEIKLSKYIQSNKHNIYIEIREKINNGETVLFVGCPCEVAALYHFIPFKLHDKLILVDLVCQGPTCQRAMREFVDYIEEKKHSKIYAINMRHAIGPWIPQYLKILFQNGEVYINRLYDTIIGDAIRIMQRPCCYSCKFSGSGRYSDITLGDYHGAKEEESFYHESGISIAVPHTQKGFQIIEDLKQTHTYWEYGEYHYIARLNPRLEAPWAPLVEYKLFSEVFNKSGLISASKSAISSKKKILRLLPIPCRILLEKIWKRIKN